MMMHRSADRPSGASAGAGPWVGRRGLVVGDEEQPDRVHTPEGRLVVIHNDDAVQEEKSATSPAAPPRSTAMMRELLEIKARGRVRRLPRSLTLSQMLEDSMAAKIGVLQVMKFSGRRSAMWHNQLLVLRGNTLGLFPTQLPTDGGDVLERLARGKKAAWRRLRSEMHFDLSEPSLNVSVALSASVRRQPGEILTTDDHKHSFEWTISVQRYQGLVHVRLRCASLEERDQWVSALRAFDIRTSTSFSALQTKDRAAARKAAAAIASQPSPSNVIALPNIATVDQLADLSSTAEKAAAPPPTKPKRLRLRIPGFRARKKSLAGRSPRSPALRKVHSEARIISHKAGDAATGKPQMPPPDVVAVMQRRFSLEDEFVVHAGQRDISARQQDAVDCFLAFLTRTQGDHLLEPDVGVAEEILRAHGWNLRAAMQTVAYPPAKTDERNGAEDEAAANDDEIDAATCQICFEPLAVGTDQDQARPDAAEASMLRCGHAFCKSCWSGYVSCRIADGKSCLSTECMAPGCRERASAAFMRAHAETSQLRLRFDRLYTEAFVDSCEAVRWCPRPGCGNAVEWKLPSPAEDDSCNSTNESPCANNARSVHCTCGYKFCFDCGNESHAPATCEQVEAWQQVLIDAEEAGQVKAAPRKEQEQVMAKRWILNNARPCPKCKVPIEKLQGCNHMVCSSCSHEYCWACLGPWEEHGTQTGGFFRCKVADERPDEVLARQDEARAIIQNDFAQTRERALEERRRHAGQEEAFRKAKQLQKRVAHVVSQYDHHAAAADWAAELISGFDQALRGGGDPSLPAQQRELIAFLQKVVRVLADCRAALKWTAVVSYFLNASETTSAEWIFESSSAVPAATAADSLGVSIDGPHRALFEAKLGACIQVAERLQHAVEGPAASLGLGAGLRGSPTPKTSKRASVGTRYRVKKALKLAHALLPLERELSSMSCTALERLQEVWRLADDLNSLFVRLARPISGHRGGTIDAEDGLAIVPALGSRRWLCDLCGWQNQGGSSCRACFHIGVRNVFARCRLGLFQQVRRCVGCSAELVLAERFESPCRCSTSGNCGPGRYFSKYGRSSVHEAKDIVGSIDLSCPECERKLLRQGSSQADASSPTEIEEVALLEVLNDSGEHEEAASGAAHSLGVETIAEPPGSGAEEAHFTCRRGHALEFDEAFSGAFECDACCKRIEGLPGTCLECNSVVCKPCAHLQNYADRSSRGSSYRAPRRRRNAVIYSSPESFQAQLTRDIQPRVRGRGRAATLMDGARTPGGGARRTARSRSEGQAGGWECDRCTFWNLRESALSCEMCNSARPSLSRALGDDDQAAGGTAENDESDIYEELRQLRQLPERPQLSRRFLLGWRRENGDAMTDDDANDDDQTLVDDDEEEDDHNDVTSDVGEAGAAPAHQVARPPARRPRLGAFDGADLATAEENAQGVYTNTNVDVGDTESDAESMVSLRAVPGSESAQTDADDALQFFEASLQRLRLDAPRSPRVFSRSWSPRTRRRSSTSLFSPRTASGISRARFDATLAESLLPPPPFISACQPDEGLGTRCLTLLKPLRRDAHRLAKKAPLQLDRPYTMEVWWETRCSNAPRFSSIKVTLVFSSQGTIVFETSDHVPDVGICTIQVPPLREIDLRQCSETASKSLMLAIRLEACDAAIPGQDASGPVVISVTSAPIPCSLLSGKAPDAETQVLSSQ